MNRIEKDFRDLFELQEDAFDQRLNQLKQKYTSEPDKQKLTELLLSRMDETKKDMEHIDINLKELTIK